MRRSKNINIEWCEYHADWLVGILSQAWVISATDITRCKSVYLHINCAAASGAEVLEIPVEPCQYLLVSGQTWHIMVPGVVFYMSILGCMRWENKAKIKCVHSIQIHNCWYRALYAIRHHHMINTHHRRYRLLGDLAWFLGAGLCLAHRTDRRCPWQLHHMHPPSRSTHQRKQRDLERELYQSRLSASVGCSTYNWCQSGTFDHRLYMISPPSPASYLAWQPQNSHGCKKDRRKWLKEAPSKFHNQWNVSTRYD